jgi:hypothetical protein
MNDTTLYKHKNAKYKRMLPNRKFLNVRVHSCANVMTL